MTWDVTVTNSLAESYIQAASSTAGAAAEGAADRKELKYQSLPHTHTFIPLALSTVSLSIRHLYGIVFMPHRVSPVSSRHCECRLIADDFVFFQLLNLEAMSASDNVRYTFTFTL